MKDVLTIDRSKWRTGSDGPHHTGKGLTQLLNKQGFMCCLGFRCNQMGVLKKDLLGKSEPNDLSDEYDIPDLVEDKPIYDWLGAMYYENTDFTREAIQINDDNSLTKKERERRIKEHFQKINVKVIFKNKYPKS